MSTIKVTDANFKSEVIGADGPVVVDFWAEWCGPCKMIGPALEEIAKEMQGKLTIAKLNIDENPGVAGTYGIRSIPTLMLFKDGKMASSKVGAAPKSVLKQWISNAEPKHLDLTATVIAFRVGIDGKIEVGLKGTDGSWVFADGTEKLPTGIYLKVSNRWSGILKELEEIVNDIRAKEADLQRFFQNYPELLQGDEYDRVVPQAIIVPDDRIVNWRADFVLHPYDQVNFSKILELKLPTEPLIKADRSGHNNFYYSLHNAIQQLRDYGEAFASKGTREKFKNAYGIDMFKPDLQLVIGRKWDVKHIGVMLERQRRDSLGIIDWDTMIGKLRRKFI